MLNVQNTEVMTTANEVISIVSPAWWKSFGTGHFFCTSELSLHLMLNVSKEGVRCRLGRARSVMHKPDKIWSSKQITVAAKMRLLKAIVWSVSNLWFRELDLQDEFTVKDSEFWAGRLPQDLDLQEMQQMGVGTNGYCDNLELLPSLKKRKLTYYGHILRTEGDTLGKDIIVGATPGGRREGRPRCRYLVKGQRRLDGLAEEHSSWTGIW